MTAALRDTSFYAVGVGFNDEALCLGGNKIGRCELAAAQWCHRCQIWFLFEMCRSAGWSYGGHSRSRQWEGLQVVLHRLSCPGRPGQGAAHGA